MGLAFCAPVQSCTRPTVPQLKGLRGYTMDLGLLMCFSPSECTQTGLPDRNVQNVWRVDVQHVL